jgi:hypothetical protein
MKKTTVFVISVFILLSFLMRSPVYANKSDNGEYYKLTVYHFKDASQEKIIDSYLQNALLPALHKMSIKNVGVFKALSNDTSADKLIYVFMPVKSLDEVNIITTKLQTDETLSIFRAGIFECGIQQFSLYKNGNNFIACVSACAKNEFTAIAFFKKRLCV